VPGDTPYGRAVVHCALAAGEAALAAELAPGLVLRAPRPGERLPGARRTVARMLLEAQVPRSERSRYPVVAAHGEPVALPGIAVAAALRRPTGLVLTIAPS
jgi:tRNA(Ile)-lysidine synthetase-like protein